MDLTRFLQPMNRWIAAGKQPHPTKKGPGRKHGQGVSHGRAINSLLSKPYKMARR